MRTTTTRNSTRVLRRRSNGRRALALGIAALLGLAGCGGDGGGDETADAQVDEIEEVDPVFEARAQCTDTLLYWTGVMADGDLVAVAEEYGTQSLVYAAVLDVYSDTSALRYSEGRDAYVAAQTQAITRICNSWLPGEPEAEREFGLDGI